MIEQTLRWHIEALDIANAEVEEYRSKWESAEAKLAAAEAALCTSLQQVTALGLNYEQTSMAYFEEKQRADALAALVRDIALREKDQHSRDRWLYSCKLEEVEWIKRRDALLKERGPTPESQQEQAHATAQPGMPTSYPTEPAPEVKP